jgi:hypothetical protein
MDSAFWSKAALREAKTQHGLAQLSDEEVVVYLQANLSDGLIRSSEKSKR